MLSLSEHTAHSPGVDTCASLFSQGLLYCEITVICEQNPNQDEGNLRHRAVTSSDRVPMFGVSMCRAQALTSISWAQPILPQPPTVACLWLFTSKGNKPTYVPPGLKASGLKRVCSLLYSALSPKLDISVVQRQWGIL